MHLSWDNLKICSFSYLIRKQNLLNAFSEGNKINIWAGVRKIYPKKVKSPTGVDGSNDSSRISSFFRNKYKSLLDNEDSQN